MGGGAFKHASCPGEPTLTTPRLKPEQYAKLKDIYLKKLRDYFPSATIACLTEAPEKEDYGDMDILVAMDQRANCKAMATFLGAAGIICHSGGQTQKCTLGVPIDGSPHTRPVVVYKHIDDKPGQRVQMSATTSVDEYAQIDVAIIRPDVLEWYSFYSSYGDMAGLLGHIVHNLGFTVTDIGLWLRLEELDVSKKLAYVNIADRDGKLFLSSAPAVVMEFLGLSVEGYNGGFTTLDALYEWLGECRLLSPDAIKVKRNNAHERSREEKRSVYSTFFYEWLPERRGFDQGLEDTSGDEEGRKSARTEIIATLRRKWCELAVDFFEKREQFEEMHCNLKLVIDNALAAELLKPMVAEASEKEGKGLNEILRAFRRYVAFDMDGQPLVLDKPHADEDSQLHRFLAADRKSLQDPDGTSVWVREHWDELRGLERRRMKVQE